MAKISSKNFFSMISLSFVVIVLAVVVVNIQKSQDINEKASVLSCPSSYLCQVKGSVESCGETSLCCPKKGARWTRDLTKCPTASIHPFPTQPPASTPQPVRTLSPLGTPVRVY